MSIVNFDMVNQSQSKIDYLVHFTFVQMIPIPVTFRKMYDYNE